MRIINWHVNIGLVGCKRTGKIEVEDDTSDEYIDDMVRDEMNNVLEWGWEAEPDK